MANPPKAKAKRGGPRPNSGGSRPGSGRPAKEPKEKRVVFPARVHPDTLASLEGDRRVEEKSVGVTLDRWVREKKEKA